jgi:hypothetical protein
MAVEVTPISLGWFEIFKIMMGTGGVSVVFSILVPLLSRRLERKREATYLAMRLAVILELFSVEINDRLTGIDFEKKAMGNFPSRDDFCFPSLGEYPSEESWKLLPVKLADEVLKLPNLVRLGEQQLVAAESVYALFDDRPRWYLDKCDAMAGVGKEAMSVARRLREEYKLAAFAEEWNIESGLNSFLKLENGKCQK